MPPPSNESRNYKLLFWIACQINIQRTGIDWAIVARDLGIKRADSAQRKWRDLFRDQMASDVAERTLKVGAKYIPQKTSATSKRESAVIMEYESLDDEEEDEMQRGELTQSKMSGVRRKVRFDTNNKEEYRSGYSGIHLDDEDKDAGEDEDEDEEMNGQEDLGANQMQTSDWLEGAEHDYFRHAYGYEASTCDEDHEI